MFIVNCESALLVAFIKYALSCFLSIVLKTAIFSSFERPEHLVLLQNIVQNLLMCIYFILKTAEIVLQKHSS